MRNAEEDLKYLFQCIPATKKEGPDVEHEVCDIDLDLEEETPLDISKFAELLDGREYLSEITKDEEQQAKELGFVVVFGQSDGLMELRGAIYDEACCYGGGESITGSLHYLHINPT